MQLETKQDSQKENVKRKKTIALVIGTVIGLIGIFGIGHIYLGYKQKGYRFLGMTAILYLLGLVATLYSEGLWGYGPPLWGIMWLIQTYDLYKLTRASTRK
jgi:hypothetical protein